MANLKPKGNEGETKPLTRQEELYLKYKEAHPDVAVVTVVARDGTQKVCALRQFDRGEYVIFEKVSNESPIDGFALFLRTCWLEGDTEIMDNDSLFLQLYRKSATLLDYGEVFIKKN